MVLSLIGQCNIFALLFLIPRPCDKRLALCVRDDMNARDKDLREDVNGVRGEVKDLNNRLESHYSALKTQIENNQKVRAAMVMAWTER